MTIILFQSRLSKLVLLLVFLSASFYMKASPILDKPPMMHLAEADPLTPQQVIIKFLQWYKVNINKANSFPILIKDSSDYFMVNKKAVSDYLNFLKSSKCISPKYLAYWQIFFDDKALQLKKDKIQSDIPEGFDFDFVLITQEPDQVLKQISRTKFKTIAANTSVALMGVSWTGKDSMEYEFEMYKGKDGWQIDYISTPNFD